MQPVAQQPLGQPRRRQRPQLNDEEMHEPHSEDYFIEPAHEEQPVTRFDHPVMTE